MPDPQLSSSEESMTASADGSPRPSLLSRWKAVPLYVRILVACVIGALVGVLLRELHPVLENANKALVGTNLDPLVWASWLAIPSRLIVRHLLTALAAPLVLIAVVQALMHAQIPKGSAVKLIGLLLLNTTVAILIGLAVANVFSQESACLWKNRLQSRS